MRVLGTVAHRLAILAYIVFALFPLYWLVKVSVTPNDLLYCEGIRLWPSRITFEHFAFVLTHSDFPLFFRNSLIVSLTTAVLSTVLAALAGYALSRFAFRGKLWVVGAPPRHPDVPAGHADGADLQDALAARPDQQPDRPHHRLHRLQRALRRFLMQSFFDGIPATSRRPR